MDSIHPIISPAPESQLKRMSIRFDAAGDYFWIEQFVENCSSVTLIQYVLDTLHEALEANTGWKCNCNDVVAEYDPTRKLILARHELPDVCVPPESTMSVADYLRILSAWKEALAQMSNT